jgi:hypothetical protein
MSAGIWFWIIYVLALVLGGGWAWRTPEARSWAFPGLIFWVLIGLVGWGVFGPPIR